VVRAYFLQSSKEEVPRAHKNENEHEQRKEKAA
jgi:hypothetical protein